MRRYIYTDSLHAPRRQLRRTKTVRRPAMAMLSGSLQLLLACLACRSDPLFVARRRGNSRDHHELHELLAFPGQLPALCLLQTIFRRRHMLIREGFQELQPLRVSPYRTHSKMEKETYDLQLILPKLLLTRLVEEWKVAHMVNENIPQNGQFRIHGRNLAKFRLKWCSKAMQSGG